MYYIQLKHLERKRSRLVRHTPSIIATITFVAYLALQPLLILTLPLNNNSATSNDIYSSNGGSSFQYPADFGVQALKDPDYYPQVTTDSNAATVQTGVTVQSEKTPAKVEVLDRNYYGFYITVEDVNAFDNMTFQVKYSDDQMSPEYIIEADDSYYGEKLPDKSEVTNSELYIFSQGIKEIEFYYSGDIKFTINKITSPDTNKAKGPTVKPSEFASSSAEINYKETLFSKLGFNLVTREEWGAPTSSPWAPTIADLSRVVVHHTATSVDMKNPKNTVKAIYNSHYYRCSNNNGSYNPSNPDPACDEPKEWWEDVGYNYLIDPYGNIYEGRAGGNGVVGAHAPPNTGSIGISILGNYVSQEPTSASLQALTKLISALSQLNNIDLAWGSSVLGHRDLAATSCPGAKLYAKLPQVTTSAKQMYGQNPLLSSVAQERDQMLDSNNYQTVNGEVQILADISGTSSTLNEKLKTTSRGVTSVKELSDTLIYTVPVSKSDQVIAETLMVDNNTKTQPNFIYKLSSWDNSSSTRSVPSDYDNTVHWNDEKTKLPEAWKTLGGCTSDNSCGGSQTVKVAVIDSGVAYENYNYDAGGTYANNYYSGLYIQTPTVSTANGTYNEGYDREYTQASELSNVNFVNPTDIAQSYLCSLRALDTTHPERYCNATESAKINHANDDNGHGTFVTGIIAANTGDAGGNKVVGITHNVSIMPIKALLPNDTSMCQRANGSIDDGSDGEACSISDYDYRSVGNSYTLATAIDYARTHGANIINLSLTGPGTDPLVESAITTAVNAGIVVVVSSGNNNANINNYFPASFNNVITVGAINPDNSRSSYSNYGDDLDIVAPVGQSSTSKIASITYACSGACSDETNANLFKTFTSSTTPTTGTGTSFAAPQVAAAAALAKSAKSSLTPYEIYNLIAGTATTLNGGFNQYTGYGILNIDEMIKHVNNIPIITPQDTTSSANGDRYTDIIAYNKNSYQINVATSTGSSFGSAQVWNSNSAYNEPTWKILKPADVNGDGTVDIIAFNTQTTQINVTLSTSSSFGGGIYGAQVWNYSSAYSTRNWVLLDPSDVNGDNMADIIAFNPGSRAIDVTLSTGSNFGGGYRGYQVWNSNCGYSTADWSLLSPADVNGDNLADLIAFNIRNNQIDVTPSTGSNFGGGSRGYQVWNSNSGYSTRDWTLLGPADVNGDKRADLIALNKRNYSVDVTLSTGYNFGGGIRGYQVWNSNSGYSPSSWQLLSPSDVNGDNLADLIAFNIYSTQIDVTLSTGTNFGGGSRGYQVWNSNTGFTRSSWRILD